MTPFQDIAAIGEIGDALVRLPLAAVLGTALALRPKRKGTPPRMPAVESRISANPPTIQALIWR